MNLGLFNRVNLKESGTNKGMYSEWTSLSGQVQNFGSIEHSVLDKFGIQHSREVTLNIVKQIASNLGITQPAEPSQLVTDREVQWCMEVICYGLSLPLTEHEAINDCVNIYCKWMTALLPSPLVCVPKPVVDDPNVYARKILSHFHYLFIPRKGEDWAFLYQENLGIDTINRQAVLCHRVLRTLQQIAHESKILESSTWEALLLFLLAINDTLLAPPTVKDDVADQLCERILSVLFEVWLLACANSFPSPPLWKTLRESCMNWRHRIALIEQWNRVNLALTSKLLLFMYGPNFPELKIGEEDLIPGNMSNDCIAQSWFRFLNTVGNPVDLTKPNVISQTQKFLQYAISTPGVVDPCQHPSLVTLPLVFLKAMKGLAGQVDAFLGIAQPLSWETMVMGGGPDKSKESGSTGGATPSPTPPQQRRLAKSFSVAPSSNTKGQPKSSLIGLTSSRASAGIPTSTSVSSSGPSSASSLPSLSSLGVENRIPLAPDRPKCNSILHLFGEWLFQASFIGCDLTQRNAPAEKRPNSMVMESTKSSMSSMSDSEIPSTLTIDKYESGRAEALGTLCRIMCSKKSGEEILPVYLARFYLALQQGLKVVSNKDCSETVMAILTNSSDLFRLDLDGARILVPAYISALESVLPDKDMKLPSNISKSELRKSSINLLLSMLVLPLHFQNITIKELISSGSSERPMTFGQLKPRLMNLIMNALHVETDPQNTHMLLGGLFLCVQDTAIYEKIDQGSNRAPMEHSHSNLLSSDSAHALFVGATTLVCHRLISSWKTDLSVSLAALELLSGLARIHIKDSEVLECKRAVKWLCDYIVQQCSRPPQAHSKDLHSTIVAAFHCCSIWLLEHPYLLKDKDCLTTVLEVAELGVSGAKSVGKPGEKVKMKEDKELKPVSMRVRDAAESLLTSILEQVGYFPSECGPESISSLLDELSLLQQCNSWSNECTSMEKAIERYRYFVSDNSVMLALLEEPLGNDQDPQPTVTLLIRGPFGRHAWTMQLRHLPRHKSGTKYHAPTLGRPVVMQEVPVRHEVRQKYFPDSIERVPTCKVDHSIPSLDSVFANDADAEDTTRLAQLLGRQAAVEAAAGDEKQGEIKECVPPAVVHEFQTARLFLSHFGLLNLDNDADEAGPTLTALDSTSADFCKDLAHFDNMSPRTCDTVHVFYVKSQQTNAQDIVNNGRAENIGSLTQYYSDFLKSLGWGVNVAKHPGWTGHVATSWRVIPGDVQPAQGGGLYDGQSQILYWADAFSEIAFVVPSSTKPAIPEDAENYNYEAINSLSSWYNRSLSEQGGREKRALSLELDKQTVPLRRPARGSLHPHTNTKIMVAWLESYEDHLKLPIDDLLSTMQTGLETGSSRAADVLVICVHLMASGLFRVHLQGPSGRVGLASPLVDGMIVSRRALGNLVRQTALNMSRRRRLDSDNYQPPHVRRRLKIQEIVQKYKREMSAPELLTYLFSNP